MLSGTLDSNGYGLIAVSGLDSFSMQLGRDTVLVGAQGGRFIPLDRNFTWMITGGQLLAGFIDSTLALRCHLTGSMDRAGVIRLQQNYQLLVNDSLIFTTQNLVVLPLYSGGGSIMGLVNGDNNHTIATTLQVDLWSTNTLADQDAFQ